MTKVVFISYAREDSKSAMRLYQRLAEEGFEPWIDLQNILPGQKWKSAIRQAIRAANAFIALLSENSVNKKGFVQKELKLGIELLAEIPDSRIYLIPARLQVCAPNHDDLRELHWVDLFPDFEAGFLRIVKALRIDDGFESDRTDDVYEHILSTFESFREEAESITSSLHEASRALEDGEHQYEKQAYGPFWDAIETALLHLSNYHTEVYRLAKNVEPYNVRFKGQRSDLPPLGLTPQSVPNPDPVVNELRRLVRKGQTNFEFATIWEYRKTRASLAAGFESVADAVTNIGNSVSDARDKLIEAIS